ncbi:MAG TPA: hypothetical protein VET66_12280, partial [Steroidobacteraceae bacterium]|nr:hypothetical protein [Steroidobacteraceae bacterium]
DAEGTLATRRDDGALVVALWNYADVGAVVPPRRVTLHFEHIDASSASVEMLDPAHGNAQAAYQRLGAPRNPTAAQLAELRAAALLPPAVTQPLTAGALDLEIPSDGLVLVTVAAQH